MGQKVNPNGIRLGINKTWSSRWYSKKEYSNLLHQDLKIKKFVEDKFSMASISKVVIEIIQQFQSKKLVLWDY